MARLFAASILIVAVLPALASEPGQPLDCSDWVFVEPGLSCTTWIPNPCDERYPPCATSGIREAFDNQGRMYYTRMILSIRVESCGGIDRVELRRYDGASDQLVAYIESRCVDGSGSDSVAGGDDILFDDKAGRFITLLRDYCYGPSCNYSPGHWKAALGGFATTFDVLHTYTPQAALGFRVPYMPEGLPAADHFDTYTGDIATLGDFSQAQPLQCDYPTAPPSVGDYLTVNDSLPNPVVGRGRYYVTAATYQGQTRYGRKGFRGQLSGRDPALLPACIPPGP